MTTRNAKTRVGSWPGFLGSAAVLLRCWSNRRAVGRLGALDDRLLADIGLTRGEVQAVLAQPLLTDPSEILALTVQRKRAARSALAREALAWARETLEDLPRRAA